MENLMAVCPECGKRYKVPAGHAGEKAKCRCGCVWVVPKPTETAEGDAPLKAVPVKPKPVKAKPAAVAKPIDDSVAEPVKQAKPAKPVKPTKADKAAKAVKSKGKLSREEEEARELIGRELGNFRIEELLGIGGFGAVYRAFDLSLHRRVALKVLPRTLAKAGKERIQRFLQEARAAAKLSHPNIVTVHQICQVEGVYFIVMELVDGKSLAQLIRTRQLSPQRATQIIVEAARGLTQAHRRGLIHRDIKPGNIMVTADDQVKMTDFGLARDVFRETSEAESGRAVGTPLYMAPEQCDGDEGDSRSDVYSMAGTYYVALTRRPPYEGQSTEEVMDRHRFDPPPDPRKVIPQLPAAVFRIIEKAMAKDPAKRYQTAAEMLTAMEALDFETLDPSAEVTLDKVSAQIGSVTPDVGSHVGAVMRSAIRRADRSTTRSAPLRAANPDQASPLKWWLLVTVLVVLVSVTAIVLAIVLAQGGDEPESARNHGEMTRPHDPEDDDQQAEKPTDTAGKTTDNGTTPPKDDGGKTTEDPEKTAKEPPVDPAAEREKTAMRFYEERVAYEKEHGSEGMNEQYRYITDHFPGTKAAELAQKAIDRLSAGEAMPEPDTGGETPDDGEEDADTPPKTEEPETEEPKTEEEKPDDGATP